MTMDISLARGLFSKASNDLEEFIDTVKAFRRQVLVIYTVARREYGVKVEIVVKSRHPVTTTPNVPNGKNSFTTTVFNFVYYPRQHVFIHIGLCKST